MIKLNATGFISRFLQESQSPGDMSQNVGYKLLVLATGNFNTVMIIKFKMRIWGHEI